MRAALSPFFVFESHIILINPRDKLGMLLTCPAG
jgi:hypothetical protein